MAPQGRVEALQAPRQGAPGDDAFVGEAGGTPRFPRHRTAMVRGEFSRPIALARDHGILTPATTLFDYGCGRGGDVARLRGQGYVAAGWDPAHAPNVPKATADVVNLGYVLNVIEHPDERRSILRDAWQLARRVLIVAVRPEWDVRRVEGRRWGDGIITTHGTFQKFYGHDEIQGLIATVTGVEPIVVAPGIFFVARDGWQAEDVRIRLVRARRRTPRMTASEARFDAHRDILVRIMDFMEEHGRPPFADEAPSVVQAVESAFGSIGRAVAVIQRVTGDERWVAARETARGSLEIFLALAAFRGRPRFGALSTTLQRDVKALFGSYGSACIAADRLLFSLGDEANLDGCLEKAAVGKVLPDAVYIHMNALRQVSPVLQLYEGCARALVGEVAEANVLKLNRGARSVSYLSYPDFDRSPHPTLAFSMRVDLRTFVVKFRDYRSAPNPPLLHRKDALVAPDYPGYEKFLRLTQQEERHGLLDAASSIGTLAAWQVRLAEKGLRLSGHRLVRDTNNVRAPGAE